MLVYNFNILDRLCTDVSLLNQSNNEVIHAVSNVMHRFDMVVNELLVHSMIPLFVFIICTATLFCSPNTLINILSIYIVQFKEQYEFAFLRVTIDNDASSTDYVSDNSLDLTSGASNDETMTICSTLVECTIHFEESIDEGHSIVVQFKTENKRKVNFGHVTVFSFARDHGYCAIPGSGPVALGMNSKHFDCRTVSVEQHCKERVHRRRRIFYACYGKAERVHYPLFKRTMKFPIKLSKEYRINLLRMSGVHKPPSQFTRDLYNIRRSRRSECGCRCPHGMCRPETCQCALSGIRCQSDKPNFPCSCNVRHCKNPYGFHQFCSSDVRRHLLSTLCRLSLESTLSTVHWEERDINQAYPSLLVPLRFRCAEPVEMQVDSDDVKDAAVTFSIF
ncbi:hypothetical protein GJ496_011023 [Pomphorhynchus laevis]|nr:hypothetical protein GJ496_011023 [Pomphorhynchus laevis]